LQKTDRAISIGFLYQSITSNNQTSNLRFFFRLPSFVFGQTGSVSPFVKAKIRSA